MLLPDRSRVDAPLSLVGGVLVDSVLASGDQWWNLAFFCSAYMEPRADFP